MRKIWGTFCCIIIVVAAVPFILLSDIEIVEATHLTETEYNQHIEVNGTVEYGEQIPMSLSYPVYIKEQLVFENDYVNKGQLLFTLDTEKMQNSVKQFSLTDYTEVYNSIDKSAFLNISEGIYASESGYITQIAAKSGDIVLSDENLCVINTENDLILKITINQDDYHKISVGDTLEFSTLIMPSVIYDAKICNKTATIRKETSLKGSKTVVDVYAVTDNTNEKLTDGLQFSGKVYKKNTNSILTLPYEYISQDDSGEYVNTFNKGKIDKVYIETGSEYKDYVEIKTSFEKDTLFLKNNYDGKKKILIKYDF